MRSFDYDKVSIDMYGYSAIVELLVLNSVVIDGVL